MNNYYLKEIEEKRQMELILLHLVQQNLFQIYVKKNT
jgi:hypothetical protein